VAPDAAVGRGPRHRRHVQGLVPASVPYFVLDRHYSYVAASGLALAATLGSSLPQPVIGLLVDKWRLGWMAAAGVSLAGAGAGLSGLAPAYPMVWLLLLASGLGVAMFHPAAGTSARADAGGSASAMSIFAAGGSAGFFLAPVLATPALVSLGLGAIAEARGIAAVFTVLCFVPALALILGALLPDPAAPEASTADAISRRALAGRRGTPRSLLPGRSRGR
jgi:MFS family permease